MSKLSSWPSFSNVSSLTRIQTGALAPGNTSNLSLPHTDAWWLSNFDKLEDVVNHLEQYEYAGNPQTLVDILKWCSREHDSSLGTRVYSHILRCGMDHDRLLMNTVVEMYGNCGDADSALAVFETIDHPNVFSWTLLIAAYARNGHMLKCLSLLKRMNLEGVKPDGYTFTTVLTACTMLGSLHAAEALHALVTSTEFDKDTVVASSLINLYGKCGAPERAFQVFNRIHHKDVVSWSSMLGAYAENGDFLSAVNLFMLMDSEGVPPNNVTFVNLLEAVTQLEDFTYGKRIHSRIVETGYSDDIQLGGSLVKMYSNWGWLGTATLVFRSMTRKDVVTWSSVIAALSQNSSPARALSLFHEMDLEGIKPNPVTFVTLIDACGACGALRRGVKLHDRTDACGFTSDVAVSTALVNMYGKCGRASEAEAVFRGMTRKNLLTWTSITMAYAHNGYGDRSLKLLHLIEQEGMKPDGITFVSILVSCCYAGLLAKGLYYYSLMVRDFSITPSVEHCGCMVDILGRSGKLEHAEQLIISMEFQSSLVWSILLTACKLHNDAERGARAAEKLFHLEPKKATPYVLLSNIYCVKGDWELAVETRRRMESRGVKKLAACCSVEIRDRVYDFNDGTSEKLLGEAYAALERLEGEMAEGGYVPDAEEVMVRDVEEGARESGLEYHTEKLAVGYGLVYTRPGTALSMTKNLRMCSECHTWMKFVSRLVRRSICVRDGRRFHHFEDGNCSCRNNW